MLFKTSVTSKPARTRRQRLNAPRYGRPIFFASTTLLVFGAFMLSRSVHCAEQPVDTSRISETASPKWCYDPMSRKLVSKPAPPQEYPSIITIHIGRAIEQILQKNALKREAVIGIE